MSNCRRKLTVLRNLVVLLENIGIFKLLWTVRRTIIVTVVV